MGKPNPVRFIEECYSLYEQKMYRVALSILRDPSAAEDAVQDAFLRLMKSNKVFDDAGSDDCKRYIITVIRNAAINIYRVRQRDSRLVSLSDPDLPECLTEESYEDNTADISSLLDRLPPKYRDVVWCLVTDNLSVRETSLRLRITEANVRKRYERAKKMMRAFRQEERS